MTNRHVQEALAHERAGRWRAASDAWRAAAKSVEPDAAPELQPGQVFQHVHRGVVQAECRYLADDQWLFDGVVYPSASAAATAAATSLGMSVRDRLSGRQFWGIKNRREYFRQRRLDRLYGVAKCDKS